MAADACLACSGSVSLELLQYETPSIIHYKIGRFAFRVQQFFRTVRYITLVNLLACEDRFEMTGHARDVTHDSVPFPEYLTATDRSADMAQQLVQWFTTKDTLATRRALLRKLKSVGCKTGASETAARYIVAHVSRRATRVALHYEPSRAA